MRILHTYCLNYNIGDYALGIGVKNLLRHNLNVDLIAEANIQGQVFDEYYINEVVNKKYDLLVIGGGGVIHGSHWPNGWFWLIDKDLIKTIKIPFIVYGVGNNYFSDELIPDRAVSHLKETNRRAAFFSVRNDESLERVKDQLSFTPFEVPDPGFHVSLGCEYDRPPIDEKYVIIQLANDKADKRFIGKRKEMFVRDMRRCIGELAREYQVVFAPHVLDDVSISQEIAKDIDNTTVLNFGEFAFDHSDKMIAYYKYAEFVVAMRGHGQIIPIGFNVPVVSLQNHPKHLGLMRKLDLLDFNVSVNADDLYANLMLAISNVKDNKLKLIDRYKEINAQLLERSTKAMLDIRESLS